MVVSAPFHFVFVSLFFCGKFVGCDVAHRRWWDGRSPGGGGAGWSPGGDGTGGSPGGGGVWRYHDVGDLKSSLYFSGGLFHVPETSAIFPIFKMGTITGTHNFLGLEEVGVSA